LLRPYKDSERADYLDTSKLKDWLPVLLEKEQAIITRTAAFLDQRPAPTPAQKAAFQRKIAAEVLRTLQGLK
jgi:hypothetical protein